MACYHLPVLLRETIEGLAVKPDGVYVDGTAGGGGHSEAIAKRLSTGRLIAIDQDPDAIAAVTRRLADYPGGYCLPGEFLSDGGGCPKPRR